MITFSASKFAGSWCLATTSAQLIEQGVVGGVWNGVREGHKKGTRRVREMERERAGSMNSKRAGSGPAMQDTAFCCFLKMHGIFSKTRIQNAI